MIQSGLGKKEKENWVLNSKLCLLFCVIVKFKIKQTSKTPQNNTLIKLQIVSVAVCCGKNDDK